MFQKGSFDSKKVKKLEAELTATMRRLRFAGEGFEVLIAPGEEGIWALVIESVMRANPDFALVAWPSGPAIVRRKDVDSINKDFKAINESTGFITPGGENFRIEDIDARPVFSQSGGRMSKEEYQKEMPNAHELYDNHEALK